MNSLILRATVRLMFPVLLLFSLFMLLRGHNEPGGGFIGGLVAAAAVLTQMLAIGPGQIRQSFPFTIRHLLPIGLLTAIVAGLLGLLQGKAFLTGVWITFTLLGIGEVKIGSPLLFDIGVYLVVIGMTVEVIVTMAEEESWKVF